MSSDNIIKKTVNQLLRTAGVDTPSQIPVVNNTTTFSTFSPAEYRNLIKGIHIWAKKKSGKGRWVAHCMTT